MSPDHAPRARIALALATVFLLCADRTAFAQIPLEGAADPHWIWAPSEGGEPGNNRPAQTRYFRRRFEIKENGSVLSLDVTADSKFTLYLDGKVIAKGSDWRKPQSVNEKLLAGQHVLAAEAANDKDGPAGFLVRGAVTPLGQVAPVHTDANWRVAATVKGDAWTTATFDDSTWGQAVDLGPLNTPPWIGVAFATGDNAGRFKVPDGFAVTTVATPEVTGSVVAFAFDDQGMPSVSVERGPIARLIDADKDGKYEARKAIAPQMNNCQGFNFIRGKLYAVGNGPEGTGIYRLSQPDAEGVFQKIETVRLVDGAVGEHGPHAIVLGPDGSLYFNAGNHAHLKGPIDPKSPCNIAYEGELLPHYNDPRGHAVGVMAPGGEIYRSDDDGKTWARVAQGFRNQYDFAFNKDGEIFTFDSDMEWDIGLPWYRPVRINHAIPGAEFGWRNGSAPWPDYYFDSLPATLNIGRGSPTGVTFYQAHAFPPEYEDNFLACDWSQGRILAIELTKEGATYSAKEKTLVSGQPLNVTDIEVGPDGAVYFTTGGRQTLGGLYRVAYTRKLRPYDPPKQPYFFEAMGLDSPLSAFSRRRIAELRKANEPRWDIDLANLAKADRNPPVFRCRALDLLAEFGPAPTDELLVPLSRDKSAEVRAKAVYYLGKSGTDAAHDAIVAAMKDSEPIVCRRACEALVRSGGAVPSESIAALLDDSDRWLRFAARIAVEHDAPLRHYAQLVEKPTGQPLRRRAVRELMLAVARAEKMEPDLQDRLLVRVREAIFRGIRDDEQSRFFRLIGLIYGRGQRKPDEIAVTHFIVGILRSSNGNLWSDKGHPPAPIPVHDEFGPQLPILKAESARLFAYFGDEKAVPPQFLPWLIDALAAEPDHAAQVHFANCLRNIKEKWTAEQKRQYWAWFDKASKWEAGFSYLGYLDFMLQDFLAFATPEEKAELFAEAAKHPFPSRVLVRAIDFDAEPDRMMAMPKLYADLAASDNPGAATELRTLILEKLGQAKRPEAHAALRDLAKSDPTRRDLIARSLCNNTAPDDLPILVDALESRDPNTTSQVVGALRKLDKAPRSPVAMRNLLRLARRTGPAMKEPLAELAAKWLPGAKPAPADFDFAKTLDWWETNYFNAMPHAPALVDDAAGQNNYTLPQLISGVLQSPARKNASAERGKLVLARAKCLDCHKLGSEGQGLGPDLTTVASRFRPTEILESIAEPSKVISDQYKPITVATADGKVYNGMPAGEDAKNLVLLVSDGTKVTIPKADIEDRKESKVSVMPEGLVNRLSYQEIADLLALFEAQPKVDQPKK